MFGVWLIVMILGSFCTALCACKACCDIVAYMLHVAHEFWYSCCLERFDFMKGGSMMLLTANIMIGVCVHPCAQFNIFVCLCNVGTVSHPYRDRCRRSRNKCS